MLQLLRQDRDGWQRALSLRIAAGRVVQSLHRRRHDLDAAAAAIDSFELNAGQTATAPPIRLVRGCLIKGSIIDDGTGNLASLREATISTSRAMARRGREAGPRPGRQDPQEWHVRDPPTAGRLVARRARGSSLDIIGQGGGEYSLADGDNIAVEYHVRRYDPSKDSASKLPRSKSLSASTSRTPQRSSIITSPRTGSAACARARMRRA